MSTLPRQIGESLIDWTLRFISDAKTIIPCDACNGWGLVPANSGSDSADFKCQECNGKGTR